MALSWGHPEAPHRFDDNSLEAKPSGFCNCFIAQYLPLLILYKAPHGSYHVKWHIPSLLFHLQNATEKLFCASFFFLTIQITQRSKKNFYSHGRQCVKSTFARRASTSQAPRCWSRRALARRAKAPARTGEPCPLLLVSFEPKTRFPNSWSPALFI